MACVNASNTFTFYVRISHSSLTPSSQNPIHTANHSFVPPSVLSSPHLSAALNPKLLLEPPTILDSNDEAGCLIEGHFIKNVCFLHNFAAHANVYPTFDRRGNIFTPPLVGTGEKDTQPTPGMQRGTMLNEWGLPPSPLVPRPSRMLAFR